MTLTVIWVMRCTLTLNTLRQMIFDRTKILFQLYTHFPNNFQKLWSPSIHFSSASFSLDLLFKTNFDRLCSINIINCVHRPYTDLDQFYKLTFIEISIQYFRCLWEFSLTICLEKLKKYFLSSKMIEGRVKFDPSFRRCFNIKFSIATFIENIFGLFIISSEYCLKLARQI